MNASEANQFITDLYEHILRRSPRPPELAEWATLAQEKMRPEQVLRAFVSGKEYAAKYRVDAYFPPGHYHSPVVDPLTVVDYYTKSLATVASGIEGIKIDLHAMEAFWERNLDFIKTTRFPERNSDSHRFHFEGSPFPWGDAIMLRAIVAAYKPAKIIEIGSGFSTACMLDSAEECDHTNLQITCIEPFPDRLHSLLRPDDYSRVDVLQCLVQDVALEEFDVLQAGDILFIDSTHVLKTGSDVHYELFSILPRLKPGVLVHVHDCPYPFEYPHLWVIGRNYSWNEAYALRAFLMYNERFSIMFWNGAFAQTYRQRIANDFPELLRNPGTSIWLTVS